MAPRARKKQRSGEQAADQGLPADGPARLRRMLQAGPAQNSAQAQADEPQQMDIEEAVRDEVAANAEPAPVQPNRRENMAELARRRAAHFANYRNDDVMDDEDDIQTGGNDARTLGPWSSARQLVDARAAAQAKREDRLQAAARSAADEDAAVAWTPSRQAGLGPRPERRVPQLVELCCQLLVEYIGDVDSLWGIPDGLKVKLSTAVCGRRKLSPEVARLFTEHEPESLVLPNCTALDVPDMTALLRECATPRLETLELGFCGRSMTDAAAAAVGDPGSLPALTQLRLSGGYRLGDAGLEALLRAAPNLRRLTVTQAPRIVGPAIALLPELTPGLEELNMDECRGVEGSALQRSLLGLPCLRDVNLNGIVELSDSLLTELALSAPSLLRVSISHCPGVGDAGLRGLAAARPGLEALYIDELGGKVTDAGILAIAESCRTLQVLALQKCQRVSDEAVAAVAANGCLRRLSVNNVPNVGPHTMRELALACKGTLEELDVSWCRGVPAPALGLLADSCPRLRRLTVWGCSQITRDVLFGHSNDSLEIVGSSLHLSKNLDPAKATISMVE